MDGLSAEEKATEVKASAVVRRVIQKIRLATPETFDDLEKELLDTMDEESGSVGSQFEKLVKETETATALGRKRVDQIIEQRAAEEKKAERPRELMMELKDLVEAFESKTKSLQETANIKPKALTIAPTITNPIMALSLARLPLGLTNAEVEDKDVDDVQKLVEEYDKDRDEFKKAYAEFLATNGMEMKTLKMPPQMKLELEQLGRKVDLCQTQGHSTSVLVKQATAAVAVRQVKELFETMKPKLREQVQDAAGPVAEAEQLVIEAESEVLPFARPKKSTSVDDMLALADKVDLAVESAEPSVEAAGGSIEVKLEDVDERIKKQVDDFVAQESRKTKVKIGQLGNRLRRVRTLVRNYRRDLTKLKAAETVENMKQEYMEGVKKAPEAINEVEEPLKAAENAVNPLAKAKMDKTKTVAELLAMADEAQESVDSAKAQINAAMAVLRPWLEMEEDEDIKKQLRLALQPETKKSELLFGTKERRMTRIVNLLDQFRIAAKEKRAAEVETVRGKALKVIRRIQKEETLERDDLFSKFNSSGSESIDEGEFLGFFKLAETVGEEGAKEAAPSSDDLTALFVHCCPDGETSMPKESFLKLIASYMQVMKGTSLTQDLSISGGKVVRQLKLGEILETIDGPEKEPKLGVNRVRVRTTQGTEGWVTVAGNAGTIFLKECATSGEAATAKAVVA